MEQQQANLGRIDVVAEGHCLVIKINRPEKRNGFTPEMGLALAQAYTRLEHDPDLRVGVLCAEGEHFTGGLDLPRWAEAMREGRSMWPVELVDPFDLREPRRSKPVVAAVQGICYTLGIELMLAADMVVAADNCRFSQLEVKRGIMATGGATVRMAERAGTGTALYHLLVAGEFGSQEALRVGYVQEIVPAEKLLPVRASLLNLLLQTHLWRSLLAGAMFFCRLSMDAIKPLQRSEMCNLRLQRLKMRQKASLRLKSGGQQCLRGSSRHKERKGGERKQST